MPRTALFLAPFDPPTMHHRQSAELLAAEFDRVIVVPSGPKPTPSPVTDSRSIHRATMADLNFRGLAKVEVDLFDLEHGTFCPPVDVAKRYAGDDLWHVVSAEWVRGGADGQSMIHREWSCGPDLWGSAGFVVLVENGDPLADGDMPPRHLVMRHGPHLPSSAVRNLLTQGESVQGQLFAFVEAYIRRHGLYRDVPPAEATLFQPAEPRFCLFADEYNKKSQNYAHLLKPYAADAPEMVVTLGGDGTMLRAIRKHWRARLPFIGINTGGLGFLLSGRELHSFWEQQLLLYQLPLLRVEAEFIDGSKQEGIAFNDTWVERATGQTAWVRVLVNGVERVPRLVSDGVLVSTAAGSNSYARAMGATPVPLNTGVLILVGSNVLKPTFWKPVVLPLDSEIVLETVDPVRRPLHGYIDGEAYEEPLRRLKVSVSKTAAVELCFTADQDPVAKLGFVQFPKEAE